MIEGIVMILVAVVFFAVGRLYEWRKAHREREELYEELDEEAVIERLEALGPVQASFKSMVKPVGAPEEQIGSGDVVAPTEVPKSPESKQEWIGGWDSNPRAVAYYAEWIRLFSLEVSSWPEINKAWNSCQKEAAKRLL